MTPSIQESLSLVFDNVNKKKCDALGRGYSHDIKESISTLGAYTSCVTACSAEQFFRAVSDFKNSLAEYYDIGSAQLVLTRKYVSGEGDYDVLGKTTRIQDSCCLPNDYFTTWDRILIPTFLRANGGNGSITTITDEDEETIQKRWVSVSTYLSVCATDDAYSGWLEHTEIVCEPSTVEYLQIIQRNVGHLILAPKCDQLAPNGACSVDATPNPRARTFSDDVCVAHECTINGKKVTIDEPLVKPIIAANHWHESCPDDDVSYTIEGEETEYVIHYGRIANHDLKYYTVSSGLPSASVAPSDFAKVVVSGDAGALGHCEFNEGLVTEDQIESSDWKSLKLFDENAIEAARSCPYGGLFEYCNMRQYASYLQRQLFDNDNCQVIDMENEHEDQEQYYGTLACLFKIFTLKCDCMEAVLNCYEHNFQYTEPLAHTIGKAASILCGFLLCQRPSVYSLFGGQGAIEKSQIMRDLLEQAGVSTSNANGIPPATFAFLTFGLGMVGFFVTKRFVKKSSKAVDVENGYRSLI